MVPVLMVTIGLALVAATVYSAKTSYVLRFQLDQAHGEIGSLKRQLAAKSGPAADATAADFDLQTKNNEIARLRQELDRLRRSARAVAPPSAPASTNLAAAAGTNQVSWLERLRQQDPERYKQIMDGRDQRRQQADAFFQQQFNRLDERLQSTQTQEEADLVNQISDTLNKMNDLRQSWENAAQLSGDERRKLVADSWQAYQTYSQLRSQDRQLQLRQLASQIGYQNPQDAAPFLNAINTILDDTDPSMTRFMGWGRGMRQ